MADSGAGNRGTRLQAFLHDLGLERFGVRASLAHENPSEKDVFAGRLQIHGTHFPIPLGSFDNVVEASDLEILTSGGMIAGIIPHR